MTTKTATVDDTATETPAVTIEQEEQDDADFEAGEAMEKSPEPKTPTDQGEKPRDESGRFAATKEEKPGEKKTVVEEKPEYVQITKAQFERLEKAAKITDDIEGKFSKAFGTIGDVQKIVRTLQAGTPRGTAVKIPDDAFAAMEKDFPEVAQHMRSALEATLKGMEGTGSATAQVDEGLFERKIEERVMRLEIEALEDTYPDWKKIVGAVKKDETPDANHPFRKWLATKDQAYQARINGTNSAGVITRAIRTFQAETKKAPVTPKQDAQVQTRAKRIQDAVRPKGDGGQPPMKEAEDDFEAGFKTG